MHSMNSTQNRCNVDPISVHKRTQYNKFKNRNIIKTNIKINLDQHLHLLS